MKYFHNSKGLTNTRETPVEYLTVNIRYKIGKLHFDAAVDINWELHAYNEDSYQEANWKNTTAIEIYCLDRPNWDIKMIYQSHKNNICHTIVDFQNILDETKKWIKENKSTPVKED